MTFDGRTRSTFVIKYLVVLRAKTEITLLTDVVVTEEVLQTNQLAVIY